MLASIVADVTESRITGKLGSGSFIPVNAVSQESGNSLSVMQAGRDNWASAKQGHPCLVITTHTQAREASVYAGLEEDVMAQHGFLFTASITNTVNILIGGEYVSPSGAGNGMLLTPGQGLMVDITRFSNIYLVAETDPSGQTAKVYWLDM
jgi:hypothetical protein